MEVLRDETGAPYVLVSGERMCLECEPCSDKQTLERAEQELRETPTVMERALRELRALIAKDAELRVPADDDGFLVMFLRPCKFYADSAFDLMKKYYEFRASHPQYCRELVPSVVRKPFQLGVISILSPRDSLGRRYMLIEAGEKWDYRAVPPSELFRGMQLALEAAMAEPRTQINGVVVVCDMKGLSFGHVVQFTPLFAKAMVDFLQDCIPIRLKDMHVVNQPYIFNMLFAIFKPFLREKLRSRIHFHGTNRASLLAHVDTGALRARHGGSMPGPEIPGDVQWDMLMHYERKFQETNSYGYSEHRNK